MCFGICETGQIHCQIIRFKTLKRKAFDYKLENFIIDVFLILTGYDIYIK